MPLPSRRLPGVAIPALVVHAVVGPSSRAAGARSEDVQAVGFPRHDSRGTAESTTEVFPVPMRGIANPGLAVHASIGADAEDVQAVRFHTGDECHPCFLLFHGRSSYSPKGSGTSLQ